MLDERALRRPEFTEGAAVALADGQAWRLPRPTPVFFPMASGDRLVLGMRLTYGREVEPCFAEAFEGGDKDPQDEIEAKLRLAAVLMLKNYDLSEADLAEVLSVRLESDASLEMWSALNQTMLEQVSMKLGIPDDEGAGE